MSDYFISPPGESDLRLDPFELVDKLREKWPNARVSEVTNSMDDRPVEWIIPMENGVLRGSLGQNGQVVVLDGDVEDGARFALWYRTVVPDEYALVFYDEGYSAEIELEEGMSEGQIVAPFLA